jgi:hypothetical protein
MWITGRGYGVGVGMGVCVGVGVALEGIKTWYGGSERLFPPPDEHSVARGERVSTLTFTQI